MVMKGQQITNIRRVLAYGWRPVVMAMGCVAILTAVAAQVAGPWLISRILDGALAGNESGSLFRWCALLAFFAVTASGFREAGCVIFAYLGRGALVRLREDLLVHLQRLPVSFFDKDRSGRLASYFMADAEATTRIYYPILGRAVLHCMQFSGVLAILAVNYGTTGLMALCVVPFYMLFPTLLTRRTRQVSRQASAAKAEVSAAVHESISLIREIKTFTRESWNRDRLLTKFRFLSRCEFRVNLFDGFFGLNSAIYTLTVAFLYWFGGNQVLSGEISVGELVALIWYMGLLGSPTSGLGTLQGTIQSSLGPAERIFQFLDHTVEENGADSLELLPVDWHEVSFKDVSFTYSGENTPTLENISLNAYADQRIAIVGPSGAGKSTMINLLLRFYHPQSGEILIGDQEIRKISLSALRQQVSLVSQEPILLATSVGENIRLGRLNASDTEVRQAARAANAHEFIERLADGYDTDVGEMGVRLSVGQKQRIAIARVVLRNPVILLLDEVTSALDAESELLVRQALENLMAGRITFTITHQLASVVEADLILVLAGGQLIASGRHDELLRSCQLYERLVSLQFNEVECRESEFIPLPTTL